MATYLFQASFAPMEDKLNQAHLEVQQLKASAKNYEGMIDSYKSQVGLSSAPALYGQHLSAAGGCPGGLSREAFGVGGFFHQNLARPKPA